MTGNPKNAMVYDAPYLQNEFGDPPIFFMFLIIITIIIIALFRLKKPISIILSFSNCRQSFRKICMWELLGANVLKSFNEDGRSFQISIAMEETDCFPALVLTLYL